jgi:hypothetical protein
MAWIGSVRIAVLIVVSVGLLVEAEVVGGKRKTADPVGCGSVTGWVLVGESEKRTTPPGRWWIPVAIGKSAGGGVHVHRN